MEVVASEAIGEPRMRGVQRRGRSVVIISMWCALVLGLGGCVGKGGAAVDDHATERRTDDASSRGDDRACSTITSGDVQKITGQQAESGNVGTLPGDGISSCTYFRSHVFVRTSTKTGRREAASIRAQQHVRDVPRLGDSAFSYVDTTAGVTQRALCVVQGETMLYVLSGTLTEAVLEELARTGVERLR
ncbi:hypothetical protein [Streptomyces sp. NPDC058701]|uniref:hypothetical protein n=1 Tax=Streptomyces sp. NPDC058701 TaxID=3346608 RepID=UPI00364BBAAB